MPYWKSAFRVLLIAVLGVIAGPMLAHDDDAVVQVTVTPVPSTVTLSRPALATFAAYKITVTNKGSSPISQASLAGTTTVGGLPVGQTATAPFLNSTGLACAPTSADLRSISCPIGSLGGNGGSVSFTVSFTAPAIGTSIAFRSKTSYVIGRYGRTSTKSVANLATTTLVSFDPTQVVSYVPAGGGTIFTGTTGTPSSTEPWTTVAILPASAPATTAQLSVTTNPSSCSADVTVCYFTTLTIPGTFDNLVVKLRRDGSTIRPAANIANAPIFYAHDNVTFVLLAACTTAGPSPGVPCIESRNVIPIPHATVPGTVGSWEFVILAKDNGRYAG